MATTEDHLRYLEGGVEVLEDYLLSSEMYWSVGVPSSEKGRELPRLTMGGLLLARAIIRGSQMSSTQQERFKKVQAQIEEIHTRWRVAWERKCQRSFSMLRRIPLSTRRARKPVQECRAIKDHVTTRIK
jgi:hypothetical protein